MDATWILIFLSLFFLKVPHTFIVYYGKDNESKIKEYKIAILQPDYFTVKQIKEIKKGNTTPVAYFSIGEINKILRDKNGKVLPFYIDKNKDGKPDRNEIWNSYYVNPGEKEWIEYSWKKIKRIFKKGFDGLFLDTVDTVDIYPELKESFIKYINNLKKSYPDKLLIINRGFSIIESVSPYIDGVVFECFSTYYDFKTGKYEKWKDKELKWTERIMRKLKKLNIKIYVLDYARKEDKKLMEFSIERARKFKVPLYITELHLDKIFFPD